MKTKISTPAFARVVAIILLAVSFKHLVSGLELLGLDHLDATLSALGIDLGMVSAERLMLDRRASWSARLALCLGLAASAALNAASVYASTGMLPVAVAAGGFFPGMIYLTLDAASRARVTPAKRRAPRKAAKRVAQVRAIC